MAKDASISGIYKITNLINGKIYIGQSKNIQHRWIEHQRYDLNDGAPIHNALKKYGLQNFNWEIIEEEPDLDKRNQKEIYWINFYNATDKEKGYNICAGGFVPPIRSTKILQYDLDGTLIKIYDSITEAADEYKVAVSNLVEACKKHTLIKNFMWRYYANNYKEKIHPYQRSNAKIVQQYSLEGKFLKEFISASEAARQMRGTQESISACCLHMRPTAYGYQWKYKDDTQMIIKEYKNSCCSRVVQINKETKEVIQIFDSISQAARLTKTSPSGISKCCNNKQKTSNKYEWRFAYEWE